MCRSTDAVRPDASFSMLGKLNPVQPLARLHYRHRYHERLATDNRRLSMLVHLPIDEVLPKLVAALRANNAAVLVAPTGAGKTTRVPPALVDAGLAGKGQVVMLEPRRVAARAAAWRMASERGTPLGREIGYQVRFERQAGRDTRVLVVTEGIFVRMLADDPFLEGIGAVVFDEFHERNLDSDLALAMVRRVQTEVRPDLKAVVERQADGQLLAWEGSAPDGPLVVAEHGLRLEADLRLGHKTGLYLDQRENRRRVGRLAAGRRVLNLYSYTGGFSVAAALGGATRVDSVDVAAPALAAAGRNFALNGLPPDSSSYGFHAMDALDFLESERGPWDLIIADPPSMAPSAESRPRALAAYGRLARLCLERLAPGGILVSCSCSSHIAAAALRGVLAEAATQAGRPLRLFALHGAGPDHPVLPAFPEGDYLQAWYGMAP